MTRRQPNRKKKDESAQKKLEKNKAKDEKKTARGLKKQAAETTKATKKEIAKGSTKPTRKRKSNQISPDEPDSKEVIDHPSDAVPKCPSPRKSKLGKRKRHARLATMVKLNRSPSHVGDDKPRPKGKPREKKRPLSTEDSEGPTRKSRPNKSAGKKTRGSKEPKAKSSRNPRASPKPKATRKPKASPKPKAKAGTRRPKDTFVPEPDPEIVAKAIDILKECKASCCTHPTWSNMDYDKKVFYVMPYWNRYAAGVNVARDQLRHLQDREDTRSKTTKGSNQRKWCQVAYFSGETPCIYTNMLMAQCFDT